MRALLYPLDGMGDPVEVVKDMTLVGRNEDCDLRLDHKSVSKMHCVLVKTDGLLLCRDLGSTNGTRVNGQRVRRAALLPNDVLAIARFKFRVQLGPGEPSVAAAEHTQQLEASEVARLLKKESPPAPADPVHPPLQTNPLPDVYPDDSDEVK
ncbi:MAG TPA: FHA domain-containing protein [Gemmataceae bacterium]|nr:FHA domain-containing protein [Gemmataceae bacterium]